MTSALPKSSYAVATRAANKASTIHPPNSPAMSGYRVLFHHMPVTCYSVTHHVILTSFPNHTPGHVTRGPAAIHERMPLSFYRQNFTTKHHGRTIPAHSEGAASSRSPSLRHHDNGLTTSVPYIYIYTNKHLGYAPHFFGTYETLPFINTLPTFPNTSHHFSIFSTYFHASFIRASTNGSTTQPNVEFGIYPPH
jgi:hypothetical protein